MIGVAWSMRSMVSPMSAIIAGSSVTTTYASSAATNKPAPARASRTPRLKLRRRRCDRDGLVESGDVDLERGFRVVVAEGAIEHGLSDLVVAGVDPHPSRHRPARLELGEQSVDL